MAKQDRKESERAVIDISEDMDEEEKQLNV